MITYTAILLLFLLSSSCISDAIVKCRSVESHQEVEEDIEEVIQSLRKLVRRERESVCVHGEVKE